MLKNLKYHCRYDQLLDPAELKAHPRNRNSHPSEQIERLAKILEYQGWRYPVNVSKRSGFIVTGHGRVQAAIKLGCTVPVVFQDFDSEEQEYAAVQSDNAIASWAELDLAKINLDLAELGPDFDIDLLGIEGFEIDVADKYADKDEDEVPEVKESICKLGDVWRLGSHRLMCGDATSITDVEKLTQKSKLDICFTSPPYNLGNNAQLRGYNGNGKDTAYLEKSDHKSQDEYLSFLSDFTSICINYCKTSFINIQLLAGNKTALPSYWYAFKDNLIDMMIWDKEHGAPAMAERVLNSVFEFIFIFSNELNPSRSIPGPNKFRGNISNIFRLNPIGKKDPLAKDHGAVFPVALAEFFIKFAESTVLDPFGGSGTTLIACEKTGRKAFLMELDPHYCDVIIQRWQNFTGKVAERLNET